MLCKPPGCCTYYAIQSINVGFFFRFVNNPDILFGSAVPAMEGQYRSLRVLMICQRFNC